MEPLTTGAGAGVDAVEEEKLDPPAVGAGAYDSEAADVDDWVENLKLPEVVGARTGARADDDDDAATVDAEKPNPGVGVGAGAEDLAEKLNTPEAAGAGAGADGLAEKLKLLEAEGAGAVFVAKGEAPEKFWQPEENGAGAETVLEARALLEPAAAEENGAGAETVLAAGSDEGGREGRKRPRK